MAQGGFFRKLRVLFLLFTLFLVAGNAWLTKLRITDWDRPLRVVVYPINADSSRSVSDYIATLSAETFRPVGQFLAREARHHGLLLSDPINLYLAPEVRRHPPVPPRDYALPAVVWWSLKLRYWAARVSDYDGPTGHIRLFVVYHDPRTEGPLDHSVGLEKGLIGVINAYASSSLADRNNVIIAHELLHTLGATDKYDPTNNQPIYPQGYADPDRNPLFPQARAEIMAGRIPLSATEALMPQSLGQAMIGDRTSKEIKWIR
jgi:hypothetical protein